MKYIVALLLSFGMLQFTMAQDNGSAQNPCTDETVQGQSDMNKAPADLNDQSKLDNRSRSYSEEDRSYKGSDMARQDELNSNSDLNDTSNLNSDMNTADNDRSSADTSISNEGDTQYNQYNQYNEYNFSSADTVKQNMDQSAAASTKVVTVEKVKKKDGFLENLVEAPFKVVIHTVGEVGEGVGHIGKGVGQGVAHIAVAPVKAVGRLFGWGTKHKEKIETTTTTTTVQASPQTDVNVDTTSEPM